MGLFSKAEIIILKETSDADVYLKKLEELLPRAKKDVKEKIQKEIAITKAGIIGEENILFELKNSNMDMVVIRDIYIETRDGLGAQIDFVVVTPKLIFIIECKNLFGNIDIDSKGNFVRTMEYGGRKHKEGIYSPITQNERHMTVLKECKAENMNMLMAAMMRKNFNLFHKSLVVLANPRTVVNDKYAKKEVREQVLRADQLIKVIRKMESDCKELSSSKKDMMSIAERMLVKNKDERKDYFTKYEELVRENEIVPESAAQTVVESEAVPECEEQTVAETETTIETETEATSEIATETAAESTSEIATEVATETATKSTSEKDEQTAHDTKDHLLCPKCGSNLVLRTAKRGNNIGEQFYGCLAYPKCRFILKMEE